MSNILLYLSLVLLSTPTFAQGPFGENPPTDFHAQINPTDPNWQFRPEDSAILRQAQTEAIQSDGFNWWWLVVPVALLPLLYLATKYFSSSLEDNRKLSPRLSTVSYSEIRRNREKRLSKNKKKKDIQKAKYDKSQAP